MEWGKEVDTGTNTFTKVGSSREGAMSQMFASPANPYVET